MDGPAWLALLLALAGLLLYAFFAQAIGRPRIGLSVTEHPGLLLGTLLVGLLGWGLWERDWTSTPLRAMTAPLLGAVVGLAILCAPVMTVAKMDFNRSGGKT